MILEPSVKTNRTPCFDATLPSTWINGWNMSWKKKGVDSALVLSFDWLVCLNYNYARRATYRICVCKVIGNLEYIISWDMTLFSTQTLPAGHEDDTKRKERYELTVLVARLAFKDQISEIIYHLIGTFRFTFLDHYTEQLESYTYPDKLATW